MSVPDFTSTWADGEDYSTPASTDKDNVAQRNNETWLKGAPPDFGASTVSAAAGDNSYNDSAAGFPSWALTPGDEMTPTGFSDPDNNGLCTIVSATPTKIVVSGATLVNEAAGALIGIIFRQAFTTRSKELRAPEFIHEDVSSLANPFPEPQLRHTYTGVGGGSEYRFLNNVLAAAFGSQTGRLVGSISDTDDEIYELLGQLEWTRTGSSTGTLDFSPYYLNADTEAQDTVDIAPLRVDEDNHVLINGGTGGGYELEVDGDVRAAEFRQAGSPIGAWELDADVSPIEMQFDGNAEAETWAAHDYEVTSTTEADINAAKLRGVGWQDQLVVGASAAGVNCPGRYGLPTFTTTISGLTTVSVDNDDNSFNDSADSFADAADIFVPGDNVEWSGFDEAHNNRTFEIVSITASKIVVTGSVVVSEAAGASVDSEFRAGFTTVCKTPELTRDGYYEIMGMINVPFGATGNLGSLMVGKIPGAPLSEVFGDGCTKFYCTGKALGETEQIVMVSKWNARAGDILRCQLANTSEAAVTAQGSIVARWLSTGEDIEVRTVPLALVLGTLTVT